MQMYPRLFPRHRLNDPFRKAERRIYEALETCGAPGFAGYEWQRNRQSLQLDFALWIPSVGRFGLQAQGGHYSFSEGEWYRRRGRNAALSATCFPRRARFVQFLGDSGLEWPDAVGARADRRWGTRRSMTPPPDASWACSSGATPTLCSGDRSPGPGCSPGGRSPVRPLPQGRFAPSVLF